MIAIDVHDSMRVKDFVSWTGIAFDDRESKIMDQCLRTSSSVFIGKIDDKVVCSWGLIPPTMLSNQAYLWMYTTPELKEHKFVFIRHSQRVIEDMLQDFPTIVGHVVIGNDFAFRWLRWLGAKFGEPQGKMVPFRIEKHG